MRGLSSLSVRVFSFYLAVAATLLVRSGRAEEPPFIPNRLTIRFDGGLTSANFAEVISRLSREHLIPLEIYVDQQGLTPSRIMTTTKRVVEGTVPPVLDLYLCEINAHICTVDEGKGAASLQGRESNQRPRWKNTRAPYNAAVPEGYCPDANLPTYALCLPDFEVNSYKTTAFFSFDATKEKLEAIVTRSGGCETLDAKCRNVILVLNRTLLQGRDPFSQVFSGRLSLPLRAYRMTLRVPNRRYLYAVIKIVDGTIEDLRKAGRLAREDRDISYTTPAATKVQSDGSNTSRSALDSIAKYVEPLKNMKYPYTDVRDFVKAKIKPISVGVWDYNVDDRHCNFVDSDQHIAFIYSEAVPLQPSDPALPSPSDCKSIRDFLSDRWDHGTHVTGIIAARANGNGIIGVNPSAMLWTYDLGPKGDRLEEDDDPLERFTQKTNNKFPSVINISAAQQRGLTESRLSQLIKNYARQVLFVAAAGNQGIEIRDLANCTIDPACLDQHENFRNGVIGVIALNNEGTDLLAVDDGNGGFKRLSNSGPFFDVGAIGIAISTLRGNWFGSTSGTSVAAPYVTGLASLLFGSVKASVPVTPKQVKDRILYTVDFSEKLDSIVRFGRINFERALSHEKDFIELQSEFCSTCRIKRNIKKVDQEIVVQSGLYEDGTSVLVPGLRIPLGNVRRISRDQNTNRFWIMYNDGSGLRKLKQARLDESGSFSFVVDGQKPEKVSLSSVADYTCALICN